MEQYVNFHKPPRDLGRHWGSKGRTVVMENISSSSVFSMIQEQMLVRTTPMVYHVKLGHTTCNPKDVFKRKVGIAEAKKKIAEVGLIVDSMRATQNEIAIRFINTELKIEFILKKYKDSGKIRLLARW